MDLTTIQNYIQQTFNAVPVTVFLAIVLIIILLQRLFISRLRKFTESTSWAGDEILLRATSRIVVLWSFIGIAYALIELLPKIDPYKDALFTVLQLLAVIALVWPLSRLARGFVAIYMDNGAGTYTLVRTTVAVLIWSTGFLVILQILGIEIGPMLAAAGIGGVALAFGLQETISNVFLGLQLLSSNRIHKGNFIELPSGDKGFVEEISWRHTVVRTRFNNLVIIPNSQMINSVIINYSLPKQDLTVSANIRVSYDSDLDHVEKVLLEEAGHAMNEFTVEPSEENRSVRVQKFGDFGIDLTVYMETHAYIDQFAIKHSFLKRTHKRLQKEGIHIPYPVRDVRITKE